MFKFQKVDFMTKQNKILGMLVMILCFNACGVITPHLGGLNPPVSNPFKELANVQVVRCSGNRSAATVEFVFTVTAHSNLITKGTFGTFPSSKFVARGTAYKSIKSRDVEFVRYTPSEVVIKVNQIPDYLIQFDRIELEWYFNPSHHSGSSQLLVFHNIPIVWQ
jgi:hypothetical protein